MSPFQELYVSVTIRRYNSKRGPQVLQDNLVNAQCASAACGMLRQMAGKDEVKAEIVESKGLQLLERVLGVQIESPACMEQALGLLTAVTLRYPEACVAAMQAGLPAAVLQVLPPIPLFDL
jgi:hypothetical protein